MTAKIKTLFFTGICAGILCNSTFSQRIFNIDVCMLDPDDVPLSFYDTTTLFVHVGVTDSTGSDTSAYGDLYYWFQTDSMLAAGAPPRLINTYLYLQYIPVGGIFDTVPIDIRPDEWRTGTVNVWCVWAGMYIPDLIDSIPCCGNLGSTILSNEFHDAKPNFNPYPNPTNQMLFITSGQNDDILEVTIMTLHGKIVERRVELINNTIDVQYLNEGIYIVELKFSDNTRIRRKIQKY